MPLTAGPNLTQRHHRAHSDATNREETTEPLQQRGPDVILRPEPIHRRKT
jgi:hypothetical protein